MTLVQIEEGTAVFIDANIFIYHFADRSTQCSDFLLRCESREVRGVTSILVIIEVCHRLMMIEAVKKNLVSAGNIATKVAARPQLIRHLVTYENDVRAILGMGIEIVSANEDTLMKGLAVQQRFGLLTNDSVIVAAMLQNDIRLLATADRQFELVREIETAKPTDV
jgi:predicted nucleic acid-binding protein